MASKLRIKKTVEKDGVIEVIGLATKANTILDPTSGLYQRINFYTAEYFGGLSKEEILIAIAASGSSFDLSFNYRKGFIVMFVTAANTLKFAESLIDDNLGNPPETSPLAWKILDTAPINIDDIIAQLKPFITSEVTREVTKQLNVLPTLKNVAALTTRYVFPSERERAIFITRLKVLDPTLTVGIDYVFGDYPDNKSLDAEKEDTLPYTIKKVTKSTGSSSSVAVTGTIISVFYDGNYLTYYSTGADATGNVALVRNSNGETQPNVDVVVTYIEWTTPITKKEGK